jgi:hypothetical protein
MFSLFFYIYISNLTITKNQFKMAYPEQKYSVFGAAMDFPEYQSVTGTTLLAKNQDGNWGYISASNLQTTLDGAGLATDASVTSLSGSIATKLANTSFEYVTGSFANDGAAASAGVPIGGLYHTTGTVKVRLT